MHFLLFIPFFKYLTRYADQGMKLPRMFFVKNHILYI